MPVELKPFTEQYLKDTFHWVNDPFIMWSMNYPAQVSWDEHLQWFERIKKQKIFAIFAKDIHIGNTCLKNIDRSNLSAELWVYIGNENFRGKGFGTEAMKKLLRHGFEELKLNLIHLYFVADNKAAEKLYLKLGFQFEDGQKVAHRNEPIPEGSHAMYLTKEKWMTSSLT